MTANDYYEQGNRLRQSGEYGEALSAYNKAISLDANSPAKVAKQMLEAQFAFYCKDYYNP